MNSGDRRVGPNRFAVAVGDRTRSQEYSFPRGRRHDAVRGQRFRYA